jgi:hypothetical protein
MSEPLYRIEELATTGWELIGEKLTRSQASDRLQDLINEGYNPNRLRAVRES